MQTRKSAITVLIITFLTTSQELLFATELKTSATVQQYCGFFDIMPGNLNSEYPKQNLLTTNSKKDGNAATAKVITNAAGVFSLSISNPENFSKAPEAYFLLQENTYFTSSFTMEKQLVGKDYQGSEYDIMPAGNSVNLTNTGTSLIAMDIEIWRPTMFPAGDYQVSQTLTCFIDN